MKNGAILFVLFMLAGCANFQGVANMVPQAAGTIASAEVFGGEVGVVPAPVEYATSDVERKGRTIYNDAHRNTKESISYVIMKLFNNTK